MPSQHYARHSESFDFAQDKLREESAFSGRMKSRFLALLGMTTCKAFAITVNHAG